MVNIGKIKGLMAENNIKKFELAKVLGINENTLANKLREKSPFLATELKTIADFFKVDINILFKEKDVA